MSNLKPYFFEDLQSPEERSRLPFLPTMPEFLDFIAKTYDQKIALVDETNGQKISYAELNRTIALKRGVLRDAAVKPAGHVGVFCENRTQTALWMMSVISSGRVAVMLPPITDGNMLRGMAAKFALDAVVADEANLALAKSVLPENAVISAESVAEKGEAAAAVQKETPAVIFFTGGSTGTPKGALLSHVAVMQGSHNGTMFRKGFVFDNITIAMLPLYHVFGAIGGFLSCLYTGTEIHLFKTVPEAVANVPKVRPTLLVLVPGVIEILLGLARMKGAGFLGDLKSIVAGGAPVPEKHILGMKEFGVRVYPGYGLTEAANLSSANLDAFRKSQSVGCLYPTQEVKVVDGELWLKGHNVMIGYWGNPEETAAVLEDGWLKTGDLVSIDEEGFMTITGRKKNMIVLPGGENIYPEVLESMIVASPLVKDCLVKDHDPEGRQVLSVEILPEAAAFAGQDFEAIEKAMKAVVTEVNGKLPSFERLVSVTVRKEDFKRMPSLKIDRLHS